MRTEETVHIKRTEGKVAIVKLASIGDADEEGQRILYFTVNGQDQQIVIRDKSKKGKVKTNLKAEPTDPHHIGATLSGSVLKVLVTKNQVVKKGTPLIVTEAMKMETTIKAPYDGEISHIYVKAGDILETRDLLMEIEPIKS
nr:biotin/lipoyl-containing protein [Liquorilactobacillus satsumensis]